MHQNSGGDTLVFQFEKHDFRAKRWCNNNNMDGDKFAFVISRLMLLARCEVVVGRKLGSSQSLERLKCDTWQKNKRNDFFQYVA